MNTQTLNLIVAFVATFVVGLFVMPILKKFKVGQVVRNDGPKEHLKKQGTPTMGGIIMLIVLVVILAINSIKYPTLILAIISILVSIGILLSFMYIPFCQKYLHMLPIAWQDWVAVIISVIVVFIFEEGRKAEIKD